MTHVPAPLSPAKFANRTLIKYSSKTYLDVLPGITTMLLTQHRINAHSRSGNGV